ncbi:MAG: endonuclease Q family protein [Tepidibacillus sp.]
MREFFADLHIHIGWTEKKEPVKISASKNLTYINSLKEAYHHKGLDMIGIIDCHSPRVQEEILYYLNHGLIGELDEGGLQYQELTILLGSEIEVKEEGRGEAHYLAFFPFLSDMIDFSKWMQKHMKNINLSSQRLYVKTKELQKEVYDRNGLFIPAHIFTPFKSVYGKCCDRMEEVLDLNRIDAVELGLSSDTEMADRIQELHQFPFITNSDAHSLQKIGREYNKLLIESPTFKELKWALKGLNGRKILKNYGLDPKLGKYHQTRCVQCDQLVENESYCDHCGSKKIIKGVSNRIDELADLQTGLHPSGRPDYIHQVPLEFIPKLGKKTLEKLLSHFGTEMNILHRVSMEQLQAIIPDKLAEMLIQAREGKLSVEVGGGGVYGKVLE